MGTLKKSPKKIAVLALAALVLVGFGLKYFFFSGKFLYAGTLEATKVDLSARLSSAVDLVTVQEGAHVNANDLLVRLACEDFHVAREIATINYNRNYKLRKDGSVSQEVLDQLRNKKEDADVKVNWCTVYSPIDGTVLSRYHEPGEWVNPGTKLLTLANIKDIWAFIFVPQPEVAKLKPGQQLKAYLPEQNNREFTGHILKINDEAEFTPKNVQTRVERTRLIYGVKVSFLGANDEEILKPGMTIEVELPR